MLSSTVGQDFQNAESAYAFGKGSVLLPSFLTCSLDMEPWEWRFTQLASIRVLLELPRLKGQMRYRNRRMRCLFVRRRRRLREATFE